MQDINREIAREITGPVDPRVAAMAEALAREFGDAARAVIFYGSCLRERQLDGLMLDFYLIVDDYERAYGKRWLAAANRLLPPNVFPFVHEGLTAKYAVLSEAHLKRECSPMAESASVFARFAQPVRLAWVADEEARSLVIESISGAVTTLYELALAGMPKGVPADPVAVWSNAFVNTYGTELRAERSSRPATIVDVDPLRYTRIAALLGSVGPIDDADRSRALRRWQQLRRRGKALTILRLAKASFTFAGGIDYLAWKINRHAGTNIVLRPWQRRWPLLAALILLPRLLVRGAIR